MHIISIVLFCAFALSSHAHTILGYTTVDGKISKFGDYVRPYIEDIINSPVRDPKDPHLRCRTNDMSDKNTQTRDIQAGSNITIDWHEDESIKSRFIDMSHLGPCIAYMSKMSANGEGDVWFKIQENGWDPKTKKWCVDVVNDAKGKWAITIPKELKAGKYLLRPEVIALHEADRYYGQDDKAGAQYYPNCVQLNVIGSGILEPKGYPIPGIYHPKDKGIWFNRWDKFTEYPIPGPPLYTKDLAADSSSNGDSANPTDSDTTLTNSSADSEKHINKQPSKAIKPPCKKKRIRKRSVK